jgi:cytoskeletal protein CcmA (bactofilin family)
MFTKGKSPDTPGSPQSATASSQSAAPEQAKRAQPSATNRAAPSIISADVKMKGSIVSQGEIQIDGIIEGDVRAASLTIGNTGAVNGEVVAETVIVRGSVKGHLRGKKVQLCTGAKVEGDIAHASLSIEPNAIFEGQVRHSQDPMSDAAKTSVATPSAPGSTAS